MGFESLAPKWSEPNSEYWLKLAQNTPRDQLAGLLVLPAIGTKLSDDAAMFLAYAVALRGAGSVSPNPMVGAVLVGPDQTYLGSGAHLRWGEEHAEVRAFESVRGLDSMQGVSIYVTLEPCSHHGRTAPCADMIARSKVSRVVFGILDPNPRVHGAGIDRLRSAGKFVEQRSVWQPACEWLARVFLHNQRQNSVFTAIKVASTPSGVIAGDSTSRQWITGERARLMGHFLRLEYDAICIGARTAVLDDPTLDIRHPYISGRMPLRVVVDVDGILQSEKKPLKIFSTAPEKTLVVIPEGSPDRLERDYGVKVLRLCPKSNGLFSWAEIKKSLWDMGITSLLLEGGGHIYQTALEQSEVDALHWFVSGEERPQGLKWPVIAGVYDLYKNGGGIPLGGDRLIELSLASGGTKIV
jgi:diaminohydroxyphosphoribosylaminopyrimidine deaminase/5-amino-6-(5-phosphoribosylamino)uracil reductase